MKLVFLITAIVLFLLATLIFLGLGSFVYAAALIPAGLMFFAASFLPIP